MKNHYLVLNSCRHNKKFLSIDDDNGGIRLTSGACCGISQTEQKWLLTDKQLTEAIVAFKNALEDIE